MLETQEPGKLKGSSWSQVKAHEPQEGCWCESHSVKVKELRVSRPKEAACNASSPEGKAREENYSPLFAFLLQWFSSQLGDASPMSMVRHPYPVADLYISLLTQTHPEITPLEFSGHSAIQPWWYLKLHIWCKIKIQFCSSVCEYSVFPITFIKNSVYSPLCNFGIGIFIKDQLTVHG